MNTYNWEREHPIVEYQRVRNAYLLKRAKSYHWIFVTNAVVCVASVVLAMVATFFHLPQLAVGGIGASVVEGAVAWLLYYYTQRKIPGDMNEWIDGMRRIAVNPDEWEVIVSVLHAVEELDPGGLSESLVKTEGIRAAVRDLALMEDIRRHGRKAIIHTQRSLQGDLNRYATAGDQFQTVG